MSQIQMQELKDWLKNPVTIQFKNFLSKKRIELLNNVACIYIKNEKFQNDIALSAFGGCEAINQIANLLDSQESSDLEKILESFAGGLND
jgi:hypothetical protein